MFYNSLKGEEISDANYVHALQNYWKTFNTKTLSEYSNFYLVCDVCILVDLFEKGSDLCMLTFKVDASHFITAPGFAFECMLKHTKVKLERLKCYNTQLMLAEGIRDGICQSIKRYVKANVSY